MTQRLLPCPTCDRHVRIVESSCPFCGGTLPLAYQNAGPARVPNKRLGRAALAAFGAAALIGCGGDDTTPTDSGAGDTSVADSAADSSSDAGDTSVADSAIGDSMVDSALVPAYGGPFPIDSAVDAADASDDGAVGNLYGAPPEP